MKPRTVQPELLDELEADHPDALRNRRDLRFINRLQGNFAWIAAQLKKYAKAGEGIIEPGAGQGDLGNFLMRADLLNGHNYAGLDLWPRPLDCPREWTWHREDLLAFQNYSQSPVVIANLILHQFEDAELRLLGERLRHSSRLIIASETLRARRSRLGFSLLYPLMNHVSRHDGSVSIEAGFRHNELPDLLGLCAPQWKVSVTESLLGTYRMLAIRVEGNRDPADIELT